MMESKINLLKKKVRATLGVKADECIVQEEWMEKMTLIEGLIETSASRNKPQATNSVSKMFDIQF